VANTSAGKGLLFLYAWPTFCAAQQQILLYRDKQENILTNFLRVYQVQTRLRKNIIYQNLFAI